MGAGLGLKIKSGSALAVVLAGSPRAPQVIERTNVLLADPERPELRQPHHAATGREESDPARVARRVKAVEQFALKSLADFLATQRAVLRESERAATLPRAVIVAGSQIEPNQIANPHIRAHALEGQLFRTVAAAGLAAAGVRYRVILEEDLFAQGTKTLRRTEAELKSALTALGREMGSPWGVDEKLAALGAWLSLA